MRSSRLTLDSARPYCAWNETLFHSTEHFAADNTGAPLRETLQGVQDIFDERGPTDATATFSRLWSITEEIMAKVQARFELARIDTYPCVERYGFVWVFLGDLPAEQRPRCLSCTASS